MNNFENVIMVQKASSILEIGLTELGMQDPASKPNLKFVYEIDQKGISYRERVCLERAKKLGAHAVYFYNIDKKQEKAQPQLYIYQKEKIPEGLTLGEIHRNIWSSAEVKIFIVISKSEITIFNASKPVKLMQGSIEPVILETFNLADKAAEEYQKIERYSARNIDNGVFWNELESLIDRDESSYNLLLKELNAAKERILKRFTEEDEKKRIKKLIIACIFIKYLEDRCDENARTVFPQNYFKNNYQSSDFIDVIRNGKLPQLLDSLREHFNGNVFGFVDEHKDAIKKLDKDVLIDFLSGEIDGTQFLLWRRYSFQHLPIEFISAIYEDFIEKNSKKKEGAYYTPPHVVNLMIDESMPLNDPQDDFKFIDPACGSGIFLVAGFRRLVDWWRILKHRKTKKWETPNKDNLSEIKEILSNNVFGVDKAREATDVTVFSLCLCLCDMLSPEEIWCDLKMVDLSQHIKTSDFFSFLHERRQNTERFDLVIGNPPFVSLPKNEYERIRNIFPSDIKTPSNQLALLFLELSTRLLKPNMGKVYFIIQASSLIYNISSKYTDFRKTFFRRNKILQILDLSKFSGIFVNANTKVAVISLINKAPGANDLFTYITPQRIVSAKKGIFFEFSHYDFHRFPYEWSYIYPFIWKANLMGGERVFALVKKFTEMKSLKDFIKEKGWTQGRGYCETNRYDDIAEDTDGIICGNRTLITKEFKHSNPDWERITKIYPYYSRYFDAIREISRYTPPMLLIKESSFSKEGLVYGISEDYLTYRKDILGINAPAKDIDELKQLAKWFYDNKKLIYFYIMCYSATAGIRRSNRVANGGDILSLPYGENGKFNLSESEKIILEDFYLEKQNEPSEKKIDSHDMQYTLGKYALAFILDLNKVYSENSKSYKLHAVKYSKYAILCSFEYSDAKNSPIFEEKSDMEFENILKYKTELSAQFDRIATVIDGKFIHILKPNRQMYWSRTIAFRDVDSVLETLFAAGY